MKNIATFFELSGKLDYPLSEKDYFDSYSELAGEVEALDAHFYIVRGQETYQGNGIFSNSWQVRNGELVESGEIKADIVFDRGAFESDGQVAVFNHPRINEICTDKWVMYQEFKKFCPQTWLVNSTSELNEALNGVKTELVVAKPIDGQEGKGVVIDTPQSVAAQTFEFPLLVQEFIDTSFGIPGIVDGLHDLRVAMVDGEILYSYFRTPPTGSYLANVARGGRFSMIDPLRLPESVLAIVKEIDSQLAHVGHRFYGVDFGVTKDGPRIIEMNSRMGLLPNRDDAVFVTLKKRLAAILVNG